MASIAIHNADCVAWLRDYAVQHAADPAAFPLFDACVTDPPYHLTSIVKRFGAAAAAPAKKGKGAKATGAYARASKGFMGQTWDGGDVAFRPETWTAVYAVLKPGAHIAAFSGTRTYHRMACAIEDAGFEIRDQLAWIYGSGFPKSHDVSKGIDKAAGAEREVIGVNPNYRAVSGVNYEGVYSGGNTGSPVVTEPATHEAEQWQGWGTALKPAWEPICLARKPLSEKSVAANVLRWGTGALNVDGCRIGLSALDDPRLGGNGAWTTTQEQSGDTVSLPRGRVESSPLGRFPANLCHDGSDEVLAGFPEAQGGGALTGNEPSTPLGGFVFGNGMGRMAKPAMGDSGSAARFFYSAKAGPLDRLGSDHPTVKPVDLMRWLVRLITPPGGRVLEPFAGSGTTGIAAMAEGFDCTMIEMSADYVAQIERKLGLLRGEAKGLVAQHLARGAARVAQTSGIGGLFDHGHDEVAA